jgi:hypothetical protein
MRHVRTQFGFLGLLCAQCFGSCCKAGGLLTQARSLHGLLGAAVHMRGMGIRCRVGLGQPLSSKPLILAVQTAHAPDAAVHDASAFSHQFTQTFLTALYATVKL